MSHDLQSNVGRHGNADVHTQYHAHVAAAQLDSVPANRGQSIVNARDPVAVGAGRNYKLQINAAYVAKGPLEGCLGPRCRTTTNRIFYSPTKRMCRFDLIEFLCVHRIIADHTFISNEGAERAHVEGAWRCLLFGCSAPGVPLCLFLQ